jgi:hypothetical protein
MEYNYHFGTAEYPFRGYDDLKGMGANSTFGGGYPSADLNRQMDFDYFMYGTLVCPDTGGPSEASSLATMKPGGPWTVFYTDCKCGPWDDD